MTPSTTSQRSDPRPPSLPGSFSAAFDSLGIGEASVTVAGVLRAMAATFEERNAVYKDNYKMVGPIMAILFPEGLPPGLFTKDQFHLFELIIVKLARFASSELTHVDSIHDAAVYSAMIETILQMEIVNGPTASISKG